MPPKDNTAQTAQPENQTQAPAQPQPQNTSEPLIIHPSQAASAPTTPGAAAGQVQPNQPPPSSLYPRSTRKIFFTVILILFFVSAITLGGALALAYNNYRLVTLPKPLKQTIDNIIALSPLPKPTRLIIESAFVKSKNLKSADLKTEISVNANGEKSPINSIKLSLSGPVEFNNPDARASEFDIAVALAMEGATVNGNASVKTVDDRIYFKVNEIPFGQLYQQLLDFKGKWYFWDVPAEYKNTEEDKQMYQKFSSILTSFVEKSQEWAEVTSKEGDYYEVAINPPKEEVVNVIYEIFQTLEPKEQEKLNSDLEKEDIGKTLDKINGLKFTMKINKDNYYLKSANVTFSLETDNPSIPASEVSLLPADKLTLNFNLTTELDNYNRGVVIVPPEGALSIEDEYRKLEEKYQIELTPQDPDQNGQPDTNTDPVVPESTTEPELNNDQLRSLISPEETILGEKYNWELELLKLFSMIR